MSNRLRISRSICIAILVLTGLCLSPSAGAAVAVQDSAPLTYLAGAPPVNTNLTSSLTITANAKVIVAVVITKGSGAIPASVTWNGSVTLSRIVSLLPATTTQRGVAIYSANVVSTGTGNLVPSAFAAGTTDAWIAGFTLSGADTTTTPLSNSIDGTTSLAPSVTINGVTAGSFAIGVLANNSTATSITSAFSSAQGGTGTTYFSGIAPPTGGAPATLVSIGSVAGLAAGSDTITDTVNSNASNKEPFAVAVYAPAVAQTPTTIAVSAGNNQSSFPNTAVPTAPAVLVTDASSVPVPNVQVTFTVASGGGTISPANGIVTTNASGIASLTSWTLGPTAGLNNNTLAVTGTSVTLAPNPLVFTASGVNSWTWTGGGNGNWSDSNDWTNGTTTGVPNTGDTVTFGATLVKQANNNDISNLSLAAINFTTPGWNITGNAVTLNNPVGGVIVNDTSTSGLNTLALPITLGAAASITNSAGGSLTQSGAITSGANALTISNAGTMTFSSALTLNGASTLKPGATGTFGLLTTGGLSLTNSAVLNFDPGASTTAGTTYDQIAVNGNLTLAGTLNVNNVGGGLAAGTYTLFTYTGSLTGGASSITLNAPTTFGYQIQTTVANKVNLVVSAGTTATWAGTGAAPWNIPGNWDALPASGTTTTLNFPTLGATYTANNVLANPFNLNVLNVTSTAANTISGSALGFGGTTPAINQNAASGTFTISNPLALNANTLFQGSGAGTVSLGGLISGTGGINVTSASGTPPAYVITGAANTFSGAMMVNGANLTLQNTLAPFGITSGSASPLGNNTTTITLGNGVLTVNPATAATNMDRSITFNDGGQLVMTQQANITANGTWAINASVTPAIFKITANGAANNRFILPAALTASNLTNTLRLELNNNVAGSGTTGGSVDFVTGATTIPCKVVFSGVAGAGGNASVLNFAGGAGRWDIGNGVATVANYTQAAGSPGLFFENAVQVLGNNTAKIITSDMTVTNGTLALSGRDASTTYASGAGHELILSAGKALTINSGAKLNVDMYFAANQNFTGGVFQLCNTVIQSGGTLNYLRSDATAPVTGGAGRNYRMHVVAGNLAGSGPASVINLNMDTQDGAENTISAAIGTGAAVTITTDNPHSYAVNDWITIGHGNNELGTGSTFAGTIPVGSFQVTGVTSNTITFASAVSPTLVFTAPKPVVELVGVGFASPTQPFVTSTASNLVCNLVVNGGLTITGTNAGTPAASTQDSSKRIANLLTAARLNALTGTGGFLAPKATGALPLVLPANTITWPNNITLQVQHSTTGAPSDIQLGGAFANHLTVGATATAPDPSAVLDGNGQTVSSSTGSVNVRGFGKLAGTLVAGANASIWPGSTAVTSALAATEILQGTGTVDLTNGKFKAIIANPAAPVKQQLNGGAVLIGPNSILSLGVQSGNYGGVSIPIIVCSSASITAPFASGNILNLPAGWSVAYTAAGSPVTPSAGTPADTVLVVTSNSNVTPVTVESFAAKVDGLGVLLSWNCVSEYQNLGFNVYRRAVNEPRPQGSGWTSVNPALIAGRITNADAKTYRLYDWAAPGLYEYKLESVSVRGDRETYAKRASVVIEGPGAELTSDGLDAAVSSVAVAAELKRGEILSAKFNEMRQEPRPQGSGPAASSNLAQNDAVQSSAPLAALVFDAQGKLMLPAASVRALNPNDGGAVAVGAAAFQPPLNAASIAARAANTSAAASARWFSNAVTRAGSYTGAKVMYSVPGVLLISRSMLPVGFDAKHLSITREGVSMTALALTDAGLVVFGQGYQDDYTDKDALFLRNTSGATSSGQVLHAQGLFTGTQAVNTASPATVTTEYHDVYFDYNYRPFTFPPWFSSQYLTDGTDQSFTINTPNASSGAASLTVNLWSLTQTDGASPDHALQLLVNGQPAGQTTWTGGNQMMQITFQIPSGVLNNGANQIDLLTPELSGVSSQISFLHSMTIGYTKSLDGSAPLDVYNLGALSQTFEVSNVPSADAWVVDARYPDRAVLVAYDSQPNASGAYTLRFNAPAGGAGHYLVVPAGQENLPISVSKRQVKPVTAMTYMPVGPAQFNAAVQPLLLQRAKEGLRGTFVDQEQIFDYYNYGRYGPTGIQNAVRSVRPQYLLLLGRTTYDYKNYSGLGVDPLCPTFLVSTTFWAQATSDSMFGDLGRGYPEVAVGRLPVNNTGELSGAVKHVLNSTGLATGYRVHAAADAADPDAGDFAAEAGAIAQAHPDVTWQANYLGVTYQTSPEVTTALTTAANGGADLLMYLGHGNAVRLGNEVPRILDNDSVSAWTGYAVFLQSTCTANWMAKNESGYQSIAIQALTQPQGGISASIASSTYMNSQNATEFMSQLLTNAGTSQRWGNALLKTQQWAYAKGSGFYTDLSLTEQIFGDPAMPIFLKTPTNQSTTGGQQIAPPPATGTF